MNMHDKIAKVAYELYEKSGKIEGRELENWLQAEKIVTETSSLEVPNATKPKPDRRKSQRRSL